MRLNHFIDDDPNLLFSLKSESNDEISFLGVKISRENRNFKKIVYRNSILIAFYQLHKTLLPYRCFKIYSNWTLVHSELKQLKHTFSENEYPENFIDS